MGLLNRVCICLGLVMLYLAAVPATAQAQTETDSLHAEWSTASPPQDGWTVGDQIPLRLQITHREDIQILLPHLPNTWGPFEVVAQTLLEPVQNANGTLTSILEAKVTLWEPGNYETPPLTLDFRDINNELHEISVPPLSLRLVSVLREGDTEKRDLKPQVSLPRPPIWPWLMGGLLATAVSAFTGWALWSRLRRRRSTAGAPLLTIDLRPPHLIAYSELDRIVGLNLPAQGAMKQHYTMVADCLRTYVQGRYHIPAMDQTTTELRAAFRKAQVDRGHAGLFYELLAEADLVKFAKYTPPVPQAQSAIARARHIVGVTKAAELEAPDSEPQLLDNPPSPNQPSRAT